MNTELIPIVSVSFNAPDLIETLLSSLRKHHNNKVYIIDGSYPNVADEIRGITAKYENVQFIPFGYNIHHGPGMAWAINNLGLSGPVLFLDSDVDIINGGMIEALYRELAPHLYGVGGVGRVNEAGFDQDDGAVPYLYPVCMLCNIEVMRQWPLPIKHGAPMVQTMLALHRSGQNLLRHIEWVKNDYSKDTQKSFFRHDWQGTVMRTGSYHYDAPTSNKYNPDLLALIAPDAQKLVEIGCGDGALARAYRTLNPICNYTGVEIDAALANAARTHCDFVFNLDIESADDAFFAAAAKSDTWVLGEVLAHITDPWALLAKIRKVMPANGTIVLSVPNAQHWSVQARLSIGDFRYDDAGLMDRAHLRWFSRGTIIEALQAAGFRVTGGIPRIADEPGRDNFLPAIRMMAQCTGNDPELAVNDALAFEYVVRAVPA